MKKSFVNQEAPARLAAKVDNRRTLYQGRVFRLDREDLILGNGNRAALEIIRHPGAAAIVPLSPHGRVVMLRQYRHAVADVIWEIPAGTLDGGEDPLTCAQRELTEETGFVARKWHRLGEITPLPGYSDERIHLFVAWQLRAACQKLDADELLEVRRLPMDEVLSMIYSGRVQDTKSICGLLLAANWLREHPLDAS